MKIKTAFSLVELMVALIVVSCITAALTPVVTKKLKSNSITIGNMGGEIKVKCEEKFGPSCTLCYSNKCILCTKSCDENQAVNIGQCICENCSTLHGPSCVKCDIERCIKCSPGSYIKNGKCEICPVGSKCEDGKGKKTCEDGTYTDAVGQAVCKTCEAGFKCKDGGKEPCAAGTYSETGAGTCTKCPQGHKCPGSSNKILCTGSPNPNEYQDEEGQSSCDTCGAGSYVSADRFKCEACNAGHKCTGNGAQTACTGAEYQPNKGQSVCITCAAGNHVNNEHTTCTGCPENYYCPGGAALPCSEGFISNAGATSADGCYPLFSSQGFPSTTNWTVPQGVTKIRITLVGGGAAGATGSADTKYATYLSPGNHEFDATGISTISYTMCGAGGNPGGLGQFVTASNVATSTLKTNGNKIGFYVGSTSSCNASQNGGSGGAGGGGGGAHGGWASSPDGVDGTRGGGICGGSGGASGGKRGGDATAFYAKYTTEGYYASGGGGNGGSAWYESLPNNRAACHRGGGGGGGGGATGGQGGHGADSRYNTGDNCGNYSRTNGGNAGSSNTTRPWTTNCGSGQNGGMVIAYQSALGGAGGTSGKVAIVDTLVTPGSTLQIVIGSATASGTSGSDSYIKLGGTVIATSASGSASAGGAASGATGGVGGVAQIGTTTFCTAAAAGQNANGYGCGGGGGTGGGGAGAGTSGYISIQRI